MGRRSMVLFLAACSCHCFGLAADHSSATISLFNQALNQANVSNRCWNDSSYILNEIAQGVPWAVQFFDADGKPSTSILRGANTFLGDFEECLQSRGGEFVGQYCLVTVQLPNGTWAEGPMQPLWDRFIQTSLRLGICVPSSCSVNDVQHSLTTVLRLVNVTDGNVSLSECHVKGSTYSTNKAALFVTCLMLLFLLLAIIGTVYDVVMSWKVSKTVALPSNVPSVDDITASSSSVASTENLHKIRKKTEKKSALGNCLLAFSMKRNGDVLCRTQTGADSVDALHGIRFLSIGWVIVGHSYTFAATWLTYQNRDDTLSAPKDIISQGIANGTVAVDSFFFLSGFLVCYLTIKQLKKQDGKMNWCMFYFHRYWRMTPLLAIVIAFCATILQYVGQGPNWDTAITMYDSWCRKNWWLNLLYVQNFVDTSEMCLSHSWYLAVDFQFYIVSPLIIWLLYKYFWKGVVVWSAFFIATTLTPAILIGINHYPAMPYITDTKPQELMDEFSSHVYIKPYCRMGAYLVGIGLGYLMMHMKIPVTLKKRYVCLGWFFTIVCNYSVLYGTWPVYHGGDLTEVQAAIYGALARTAWAVGVAWITFACHNGYGGIVNSILSWKMFIPFSRLTYAAYLIHPVVMAIFYGSQKSSIDYSAFLMIYFIIGNTTITFAISLLLSLLYEVPFAALERVVFHGKT